jgi:hypothetical protein
MMTTSLSMPLSVRSMTRLADDPFHNPARGLVDSHSVPEPMRTLEMCMPSRWQRTCRWSIWTRAHSQLLGF